MKRQILHVDVNNAFLSWLAVYKLKNGETIDIRDQVAVIGGDETKRSGIVLAKSYKAKQFGIVTGETLYSARQKCRNLQVYQGNYKVYKEYSNKLYKLLLEYTDKIERYSIDECFLDMTNYLMGDTLINKAKEINLRVKEELGFTVNVGISDVKVLAKMASDFEKPDKVHTLYKEEIQEKMWKLPVEDLFMAGKSSVNVLHKLGIFTIGQLAKSPVTILDAHLKSHGRVLWEYANGIDESVVNTKREDLKGVGNSTTLPKDLDNIVEINRILLRLSEKVSGRLREGKQKAKTVAVEIKYNDFTKCSKQITVDIATDSGTEIYNISKNLFKGLWSGRPVRLLGVRTANLIEEDEPEQLTFMDIDSWNKEENNISREKMKKLDKALDLINAKYGSGAVKRASLLNENRTKNK